MKRKYEQEEQKMLRQQQQSHQQSQHYASYPPQNAAYATPSEASNLQALQPMRLFDTTAQQVNSLIVYESPEYWEMWVEPICDNLQLYWKFTTPS